MLYQDRFVVPAVSKSSALTNRIVKADLLHGVSDSVLSRAGAWQYQYPRSCRSLFKGGCPARFVSGDAEPYTFLSRRPARDPFGGLVVLIYELSLHLQI